MSDSELANWACALYERCESLNIAIFERSRREGLAIALQDDDILYADLIGLDLEIEVLLGVYNELNSELMAGLDVITTLQENRSNFVQTLEHLQTLSMQQARQRLLSFLRRTDTILTMASFFVDSVKTVFALAKVVEVLCIDAWVKGTN